MHDANSHPTPRVPSAHHPFHLLPHPRAWSLALALLLLAASPGAQLPARAGADVVHGPQPGFFLVPLPTIPGDTDVLVFSEGQVDVQIVFRPNGTLHFDERKVIETTSSEVFASNYDYRLLHFEIRNRVNLGKHGQSNAYLHLELTLLRIDRETGQPIAQLHGEGQTHLTVNALGEWTAQVESMTWIESPEP